MLKPQPMVVGKRHFAEHVRWKFWRKQRWDVYPLGSLFDASAGEFEYFTCSTREDATSLIAALDRTWETDHALTVSEKPE